ncbi:UNVERIFIED_CONTAM: hypothetical protein Scaly_1297000 [Sesamum calycinum]|uniref:Uncharacterized protein n=1 Tax=Sesamum calycinum TaxID=2727403 RepID=A0AAW2Q6I9_9LAMI
MLHHRHSPLFSLLVFSPAPHSLPEPRRLVPPASQGRLRRSKRCPLRLEPCSNLSGPFPSILCRLKSLSFISLYDNFINSTLVEDELALCQSLEHLDLAQNYLTGELPRRLADLPNLKYLDLTGNNFSGVIPDSFGTFQKLEVLSLVENLLEGTVPAFLGNVSTLKQLNLSYNPFSTGRIPPELGNLTNLEAVADRD